MSVEPGALAADLFLLALDESGGRPAVPRGLLARGLAGAALADLVVAGALTVDGDRRVLPAGPLPPGADETAALVLDSVAYAPRRHVAGEWVDALGAPLPELVQRTLVRRGVLTVAPGRGVLGRRRARLLVHDRAAARAPATTLCAMVRDPATFTLHGAFVLVLISALGLEGLLEPEVAPATTRSLAAQAGTHLPGPLALLRDDLAGSARTAPASRR